MFPVRAGCHHEQRHVIEQRKSDRRDRRNGALIALLTLATMTATATASAQTAAPRRDATDAEKVADALKAGPTFITKDAAILDWPSTPDGDYRVLRKGTSVSSSLVPLAIRMTSRGALIESSCSGSRMAWQAERLTSTGLASHICTWVPGYRTEPRQPSLQTSAFTSVHIPWSSLRDEKPR